MTSSVLQCCCCCVLVYVLIWFFHLHSSDPNWKEGVKMHYCTDLIYPYSPLTQCVSNFLNRHILFTFALVSPKLSEYQKVCRATQDRQGTQWLSTVTSHWFVNWRLDVLRWYFGILRGAGVTACQFTPATCSHWTALAVNHIYPCPNAYRALSSILLSMGP